MSLPLRYILAALLAYLLGSVSTGTLVSRAEKGPDLTKVGSHNTGATNALRVLGVKDGLIVFFGDYLKAVLACFAGQWITGTHEGMLLAGLCVVIGHNWPVFFGFRGGKGVASSIAVMLVCYPIPALLCYALGILLILIWRYVSLGSMSVLVAYALMITFLAAPGRILVIVWAWLLAVMCLIRHRENLIRLCKGCEHKLGDKAKAASGQTAK